MCVCVYALHTYILNIYVLYITNRIYYISYAYTYMCICVCVCVCVCV